MPTIDDLRAVLHDREADVGDIDTVLERATARTGHRRSGMAALLSAACVLALALGVVFGTGVFDENTSTPAAAPSARTYAYTGPTPAGDLIPADQRHRAAPFTGPLLDGGSFELAEHRGRVVVVGFWATWCGPCRGQMATLAHLADRSTAGQFTIVGIDSKEMSKQAPRAFVREQHISYPVVWDPHDRTAAELGDIPAQALPVTVLIDSKQRVAAVYIGTTTSSDIHHAVDTLTAES